MEKTLVILEVSKKQDYIFSSNRLRENKQRSGEIAYVTGEDFFKETAGNLFSAEKNLVYSGGGHTVLQFDSSADARTFTGKVTYEAMKRYEGMEVYAAPLTADVDSSAPLTADVDSSAPGELLLELTKKLEKKKSLRRASFGTVSFGVEQLDKSTHRPVSTFKSEETDRFDTLTPPSGKKYARDLKDLNRDESIGSNFIAVVHIDGNAMGARVQKIYEKHKSGWDECCSALKRFSAGIQADFTDAFDGMVRTLIYEGYAGGSTLPVRDVILAGDDVCFITAGKLGIHCAEVFLRLLAEKENPEQPGVPYAACAGIAMVHESYPFHKAYDMAEELCSSAKRFGASIDPSGRVSAMDWHIEFGQLKGSLEDTRKDYVCEDSTPTRPSRMELRPVTVCVPDDLKSAANVKTGGYRTIEFFKHAVSVLDPKKVPRSKLKGIRPVIKEGRIETLFYLKSELIYEKFPAEMTSACPELFAGIDGVSRSLIFDAVEMSEHCLIGEKEVI